MSIETAVSLIKNSQRIAVLTGAGVSKESGIPTFRDAMDGLWAKYDPQQLATPAAFLENPKLVWDWYEYRREAVLKAAPNPGHIALAKLENLYPGFTLITQNVDDLHERGGSKHVVHLHGSILQSKCFFNCGGNPTLVDVGQADRDAETGVPKCPHCGKWVRPNVVWFGEALPPEAFAAAGDAAINCDVMIVIGTSGKVEPAASLSRVARTYGAKLIEVNPDQTPLSESADVRLRGASGVIFPELIRALE